MARMYYDTDANLDLLANKTIAIIGYGSQGTRPRPQPQRQRHECRCRFVSR